VSVYSDMLVSMLHQFVVEFSSIVGHFCKHNSRKK